MYRFIVKSWSRAGRRETTSRLPRRVVGVLAAIAAAGGAFAPAAAQANIYNGLLYGGTTSWTADTGNPYPANTVLHAQSWSAPAGVQFGGFAYTSAGFDALNADATGGLSAGFKGSGGSAPSDLNFPWTGDCSVSEGTPRIWITDGTQVTDANPGPGSSVGGNCDTSGNSTGWNFDNSERESGNYSVNPQSAYQTLTLSVWCARDADCSGADFGGYSVTNLSASFDDSYNQPAGTASWNTAVSGADWYQTDNGGLKLEVSASDPAGVCSMSATLSGPSTVGSGALGNQGPGVVNVGGQVGEEFQFGTSPCWTGTAPTATWTLPAGIVSGMYSPSLQASNPGNYQGQGYSPNGSPTVAGASSVNIDDTIPQISWSAPPGGWTSQTSETLDVTVGPSGLTSLSCTDNGSAVTPVRTSGSPGGSGTTVWTIPTAATGANAVACTARNGDANTPLSGSTSSTFDVDAVIPTIAFDDSGYTAGQWTNAAQTVKVVPTVGPSGLAKLGCSLDGNTVTLGAGATVRIVGNSPSTDMPHVLSCYAQSSTGETNQSNPATFDVAIDTDTPTISFGGAAADGSWVSGTPTVVVTGSELNATTQRAETLSGIGSISCSVNGVTQALPRLTSGYATSFQLTNNGANRISCTPTTVAGTTGRAFTETVNVDNPGNECSGSSCDLTVYGSSPLIDDGADPYSNGPSQSTWYRTANPVTITANLAPGQAPVASISCTGALSGTWPLSDLNTDAAGGEKITVSVPPPGGQLSCTARDAASNVYQLGSYQFEEDNTAPSGQFDQLSASTPDDIEVTVDDPGGSLASGVGYVHVYATNTSTGSVYDLGQANLASGHAHVYEVNLDDADAPAGTYRFDAQVGDIAGNTADLTAGPQGSTTVWLLPLRDNTQLTLTADHVNGAVDNAVPGALQADVPNTSTNLTGIGSTLKLATVHGSLRGRSGEARAARSAAVTQERGPAVKRTTGGSSRCGSTKRRRRMAAIKRRTRCRRAGSSAIVTVPYGRRLTIRGRLHNLKSRDNAIAGATIDVWAQVARSRPVLVGHTRTNRSGAYRFTLRGGATRNVYVTYAGTRRLRAAVTQLKERFAGRVTISANRAAAGKRLTIRGRVTGGHIPPTGLNITVDGKIVGYPGSQQLGTVHTNARGVYRYSLTLPKATRGLTYRLWLVVQSRLNPRWPFVGARSRALTRKVG